LIAAPFLAACGRHSRIRVGSKNFTEQVILGEIVAQHLKDRLRKSDIDEVWASAHYTPEQALRFSLKISLMAFTVEYHGVPVAIFGVAPDNLTGSRASIWLLGTDDINRMRITFLKESRKFIRYFLWFYPVLYNFVDDRNKKTIEWLTWCGAQFLEPAPYGYDGLPFRFFELRRDQNV
jgi:hypothetical protein